MSTMNADTRITTRRISIEAKPPYGTTGLLARAVVVLATIIAGADR